LMRWANSRIAISCSPCEIGSRLAPKGWCRFPARGALHHGRVCGARARPRPAGRAHPVVVWPDVQVGRRAGRLPAPRYNNLIFPAHRSHFHLSGSRG
jgi:hypothetical protein